MNATLTRRLALTAAALAAAAGFAATPAHAATRPGSCDIGAPSKANHVCIDSDDPGVAVGPAHTDNGVLSDDLDVDWYDQIGGLNRKVVVRGSIFIDAGAVGKATLLVRCLTTGGSTIRSGTAEITSTNSFHTGVSSPLELECNGNTLDKVDIKVTFKAFGDPSSATKAVSYKGK